jgi:hypothetical protein
VLRFETPGQFLTWDSAPCQRWIEQADALDARVALPELPTAQPPPKWKTTLLGSFTVQLSPSTAPC